MNALKFNPLAYIYATGRWLTVAFFLWACTPAQSTPTATATPALFPTMAGPVQEATLPPTWTPTFTPSPAPPTATETPAPTLTPVPTLTAAEICAGLTRFSDIPERKVYRWDHVIPLVVDIAAEDVQVRLLMTHRRTGANQGVELAGGQSYFYEFPVNWLPVPGLYDWQLVVISPEYGEICLSGGTFIALDLLAATPTPTPTAAPTAD